VIHLERWHTEIVRIRPGTKTERGSTVPDWTNASRLTIPHCLVQPASTELSQDGRILGVTDGLAVCASVDSDILPGDRIEYMGDTYIIDGDPQKWVGVGRLEHMKLNLKRWRG